MNAEMAIGRKLIKGIAIVSLLFAIGCGKSEEQEAKDLASDGNQRISQANATAQDLYSSYGIKADASYSGASSSPVTWSKFTPSERKTIRAKLNGHISSCGRIIEIANHKNVYGSTYDIEKMQSNARQYLSSLDSFEASQR